jgi:hypothetical protein
MLFWGGLMLACVLGLQWLARALTEFSLPRLGHPCLLLDGRTRAQLLVRLGQDPWRALWLQVQQAAWATAPSGDWSAQAARLRAAALAYSLSGNTQLARRASAWLRRFPRPASSARLSCRDLSHVALAWAEAYDLLHGYLAFHHRLEPAGAAVARLAHRLYYTSPSAEEPRAAARLWRACALTACALALADWRPTDSITAPAAWYAKGRAELRRALAEIFRPQFLTAWGTAALGDLLRAYVPVAPALRRAGQQDPAAARALRQAVLWVLLSRLPDGSRLEMLPRPAQPFPVHLCAAAEVFPEAFAWDYQNQRARELSADDAVDALCCLPPVGATPPGAELRAAAFGPALLMPSGWGERDYVLMVGLPDNAREAAQDRHCLLKFSVPLALARGTAVARGQLSFQLHLPPDATSGRYAQGFPAAPPPCLPDFDVSTWLPGAEMAWARWAATLPQVAVVVDWLLVNQGFVLSRIVARLPGEQASVHVQLSLGPCAELYDCSSQAQAGGGGVARPLSAIAKRLSTHQPLALIMLGCRTGVHPVCRTTQEAIQLALPAPQGASEWRCMATLSGQPAALRTASLRAKAALLLWQQVPSERTIKAALVVDGEQLMVAQQPIWQGGGRGNFWWSASGGLRWAPRA